jgi:hypothetical protein
LLGVSKFFPKLGLGMGRFKQVLAFLATQPVTIGFGFFQPPIISENNKIVGYLGRTGMVAQAGWFGCLGGSGIFRKILTRKS